MCTIDIIYKSVEEENKTADDDTKQADSRKTKYQIDYCSRDKYQEMIGLSCITGFECPLCLEI